mmetsp:Transcript_19884/g.28746  ORF Transcript_19884/g.28746 Transcript_19884/m.28746 type:complete len:81 (+) Transcript_19884:1030-1272(+)
MRIPCLLFPCLTTTKEDNDEDEERKKKVFIVIRRKGKGNLLCTVLFLEKGLYFHFYKQFIHSFTTYSRETERRSRKRERQ